MKAISSENWTKWSENWTDTIVGAALCGRPIGLNHVGPSDRAATEDRPYSYFDGPIRRRRRSGWQLRLFDSLRAGLPYATV